MSEIQKKNAHKAVIIGLDGVPYTLLEEYIKDGIMPGLARMASEGRLLRMKSSMPEVSSVAWSSFMTGKNPGEHGIFGFMEIDRESYEYKFPNFDSLRARPFWEELNIPTIAFNIPQTYPARAINGVMVSGFVALDLKKATYPERVYKYLEGINYRIDVNVRLAAKDPQLFFEDLFKTFQKRREVIKNLYEKEEWQLFIGTITEADRLHHFFFDSSRGGEYYEVFLKFYRELDTFLAEMYKKAQRDRALFLTCSDHGFAPIKSEVYINRWLIKQKYLTLESTEGFTSITEDSKAFCLDPSRIYIHLKGKFKRAQVDVSEYQSIRAELAEKIKSITYEGMPVIKAVFFKEDIFKGPLSDHGPDIYLMPEAGFDLKGSVKRNTIFGTAHFRGMHTYDDAHLYTSHNLNLKEDLKIEDIAGIIIKERFA